MLYNKDWDTETKTNIYTMESLVAWLEKQPFNKIYDYANCKGKCLLGLYLGGTEKAFLDFSGTGHPFEMAVYRLATTKTHTMGAMLKRIKKAL